MFAGIRSRLGRKLTVVFLMLALGPVVLVSFVVYQYSVSYISEQQKRSMIKEAKLFETVIRERLHFLGDLLQSGQVTNSTNELKDYFLSINLPYNLKDALKDDSRVGLTIDGSGLIYLHAKSPQSGLMHTHIAHPNYLFEDTTLLSREYQYCVFSADHVEVYCTANESEGATNESSDEIIINLSQHSKDLEAFLSGNWFRVTRSFFPGGQLEGDNWLIVTSVEGDTVLEPIRFYQWLFAGVFGLTIFIVLLASNRQISKLLTPLNSLNLLATNVARQQFETDIVFDSEDEFQDLGNTFNQMSRRISGQFHILQSQSEVDRLIASETNLERIFEVVWTRIKPILLQDFLCVAYRDFDNPTHLSCYVGAKCDETPSLVVVELVEALAQTLKANPKAGWFKFEFMEPDMKRLVTALFPEESAHYFIAPVFLEQAIQGFIILGCDSVFSDNDAHYQMIDGLSDRLAVSISSAQKAKALNQMAHYDYLTGLPNRKLLRDCLNSYLSLAVEQRNNVVVVFCDLDNFKQVNDSLGHSVGDQLLVNIADKLNAFVGNDNLVSREGGDEFILVFPNVTDMAELKQQLDRLLNMFAEPIYLAGHFIHTSLSMGLSVYPRDGRDVERLLMNADTALYQTKVQGKASYSCYDESMNSAALARLELENLLWRAIETEQFVFYYQPLVNIENGKLGFEALIRWNHPEQGLLSPFAFIKVAEETGLILKMGTWMFETIFAQIENWLNDANMVLDKVSINVSPLQLLAPDFQSIVEAALNKHPIPVKYVELEITEGVFLSNQMLAAQKLEWLSEKGFSLALDDFGTGYSSLSYLQQLPFNRIKIDRSFVIKVENDENARALVVSIIRMGHSLGLKITAEGIENAQQYSTLAFLGSEIMQGYFISKPLAVDGVSDFYIRHCNETEPYHRLQVG